VVWLSALGGAVYSQVYRYRHVSNTVQQQQTKWVVFGIAMGLALFIIVNIVVSSTVPVPPSAGNLTTLMAGAALMSGALLLIPLSIGVAILRHHLFDVDVLINRTLVYLTLTAIVVGTYMFMVGYLSTLFHAGDNLVISILAAGCVAVLFAPLRDRLQRGVNRLMYGERDDPYTALTRLGRRLEASLAPESVLSTVVTTVREVLKLPYVAIYLKQDHDGSKIVAESASPSLRAEGGRIRVPGLEREGLCVPLIHQGETLGYIVLGPRAPNEAFSSADLRLLDDLAPQVGAAVHAVRLTTNLQRMTEDLQHSREHLVNTREEERRRMSRDLHDGLGPTLASLVQLLDTTRTLVARDPDAAVTLLGDVKDQIKVTITDIRRLVYALRPPVLDELGLVSAIGEHIGRYNQPNGLQVSINAPDHLPLLPAAVEVAAYHIALEAVTNVARHANAQTCRIRLWLEGGLCLEITDDGDGMPTDKHPGIGLTSMHERAAELGGEFKIEPGTTHGTRVWARLPLPTE
jgi:signal transduction histidine kinase